MDAWSVRRGVARHRSPAVRSTARTVGSLVFWTSTAIGMVIAVGILDVSVLEDLGDVLSDELPNILLALVMLIVGYAVAVAVAAAVGQSARRASGVRQKNLERLLRFLIMVAAAVLALTQVGVSDTMLAVLLTVLVAAPAVAMAMLSAFGGRDVASQLAAGRALRHQLREGWTLSCRADDDAVVGRIVELHPTSVEVETGRRGPPARAEPPAAGPALLGPALNPGWVIGPIREHPTDFPATFGRLVRQYP